MSASLIITIDTSEKKIVRFPPVVLFRWRGRERAHRVLPIRQHLATGDYAARGFEYLSLVETKRSFDEVGTNVMTSDLRRFRAELQRLVDECRRPLLLLELSQSAYYRDSRYATTVGSGTDRVPRPNAWIIDKLFAVLNDYPSIALLWLPPSASTKEQRRLTWTGTIIAKWLLSVLYTARIFR